MHVEFHYSACPWVDVDVRVVGISNRKQWIVRIFACVIQRFGHPDEVAATTAVEPEGPFP